MKKLESAAARASGMMRLAVLVLALLPLPAWSAVSLTSPNNSALYLAPASAIPVKANASASGGATVVQVQFYANGNLIGTDTTSPYQFDWTSVAAGTYVITAKMTDSNQVETTSSPRTINVAANNTAPSVSLTAPANNASYITPSNVTATATASGPELNDLLQRVEFYLNGNLAATVTSAPYTTSLTGLADGTYRLTAVAVDGQGAQTTSAARNFSIGQNQPPTVSITTPLDNSKWHSPAGFPFMVAAAAPETNDTLTVEFYANGNLIGTRTNAPWSITTSNLTAGTYVLTAKAIDGQGANTTSAARTIVVSDTNNNPTVSISAPAANSNFPAPAPSITVSASANAGEVNGSITRVEFYVNGQLVNTDTAGPFSFNWTNVPAGSYAITAKAVDQLNGETTSAAVNVTVGAASIYFVHTDHLDTPRLITNNVGQAVWTWNNDDPFGANVPNENPSALGDFTCNLRLPGQYFDKETNLHYNYFRDFAPDLGRYWQSDPIGLRGGINTYGYARGNPIGRKDPSGLLIIDASCSESRKILEDAERRIWNELERSCNSCGSSSQGCVPCDLVAALQRKLQTSTVKCSAGAVCGNAVLGGSLITMMPSGISPGFACKCAASTLLHELLHNVGLSHETPQGIEFFNAIDNRCIGPLCRGLPIDQ